MKAAMIAQIFLAVSCGLSGSRVSEPVEDAFVMPLVRHEPRPKPLPYNLDPRYAAWVIYYSDETGVPLWMASRMFGQESVGDPLSSYWNARAVSWAGALGLAQILRDHLTDPYFIALNNGKPIDPFDPETAIRVGLRYLADLYATTGSWKMALMSYNGGLARWMYPKRGWMPETVDYVRAILGGAQ